MSDAASPDLNLPKSPQDTVDQKISRRGFLKKAVVLGGAASALAGTIPTHFYGIFDTKREETIREQSIEDRFGIEILSANQAYDAFGKPLIQKPSEDVIFNDEQLGMIEEFLPLLPGHFTSPFKGNKLNFSPVNKGFSPGMLRGGFTIAKGAMGLDNRPMLLLVSDFFQPYRKGFAFRVLAHELVHRVDYEFTNHALWEEVNEILGYASFADFRDSLLPTLDEIPPDSEAAESVRNWIGGALKGFDDKGKDNPDEFLGILGGAYVGGHKDFDLMSIWLGKETTDRLYGFMRDRVFEGREYNGEQRPDFLDEVSYKD